MADDDITIRLLEARSGEPEALDRLYTAVYAQLKTLARRELRRGRGTPTLGATGLVHEAYLRLVDRSRTGWNDRGHFFAVAARAMRQIVIDQARRKRAGKRGGGVAPAPLDEEPPAEARELDELLAVDEALTRLAAEHPRLVRVVDLCFFTGLTVEEAAEALSTGTATVKRDWRKAKALLHALIRDGHGGSGSGGDPGGGPAA